MSQPNERLVSLADALEEFYREQMAKAAREGRRIAVDLDLPTIPISEVRE